MMEDNQEPKDVELPNDITIASNLSMNAHGFADENHAKTVLYKIHSVLSVLSRTIDLSKLDGVTVSYNYEKSLAELDRGYETNFVLTPTNDVAIGVAMTPRVIRDGKVLSHMVLNAGYVAGILEEEGSETDVFFTSLHLLGS